jgi:hypothetical protein
MRRRFFILSVFSFIVSFFFIVIIVINYENKAWQKRQQQQELEEEDKNRIPNTSRPPSGATKISNGTRERVHWNIRVFGDDWGGKIGGVESDVASDDAV